MAAKFCPQCGQEVSPNARFCANCAAPIGSPAPANATQRIPRPSAMGTATAVAAPPDTVRRVLLPALAIAFLCLIIAVGVMAAKLRQDSLLQAQSQTPVAAPPILNADSGHVRTAPPLINAPSGTTVTAPPLTNAPSHPAPPAPPLTNAPTVSLPGMPADVAAYLKFLQGIEARRVALANDTTGTVAMLQSARSMQGDQGDPEAHNQNVPTTVSKIGNGYAEYSAKWNQLTSDFRAYPTIPEPCARLANLYYLFLTGYAKTVSALQVAVLNGDLGQAMGAQGEQKQLNTSAVNADDELGRLCSHYNSPKPFSIQPDGSSSSLMGL